MKLRIVEIAERLWFPVAPSKYYPEITGHWYIVRKLGTKYFYAVRENDRWETLEKIKYDYVGKRYFKSKEEYDIMRYRDECWKKFYAEFEKKHPYGMGGYKFTAEEIKSAAAILKLEIDFDSKM